MPTDAMSGWPVIGHTERNKFVVSASRTRSSPATSDGVSTSYSEQSTANPSKLSPSSSANRSAPKLAASRNEMRTGAPTPSARSREIVVATISDDAYDDCANEPRYSFIDFDSTIDGDSAGTSIVAMAIAGLPRGSREVTSYAVQTSRPENGSEPVSPSAARCGARGTMNSCAGS